MELPEGWEKKALILLVVVVLVVVIYAYNPFQSKSNVTVNNQSYQPATVTPMPFDQSSSNKSANNSSYGNGTFQITADQAKNIAENSRPGYKAGVPMQGTILLNSTTIAVWMVPLSKSGSVSKTLYIDVTSGRIVQEA
jgi:hypothetical protein